MLRDEFCLIGLANGRNCHIWGCENPCSIKNYVFIELYSLVEVGGTVDLFVYEDEAGHVVNVNGVHYGNVLSDCFFQLNQRFGHGRYVVTVLRLREVTSIGH